MNDITHDLVSVQTSMEEPGRCQQTSQIDFEKSSRRDDREL